MGNQDKKNESEGWQHDFLGHQEDAIFISRTYRRMIETSILSAIGPRNKSADYQSRNNSKLLKKLRIALIYLSTFIYRMESETKSHLKKRQCLQQAVYYH